jgi:hypothetical protein
MAQGFSFKINKLILSFEIRETFHLRHQYCNEKYLVSSLYLYFS